MLRGVGGGVMLVLGLAIVRGGRRSSGARGALAGLMSGLVCLECECLLCGLFVSGGGCEGDVEFDGVGVAGDVEFDGDGFSAGAGCGGGVEVFRGDCCVASCGGVEGEGVGVAVEFVADYCGAGGAALDLDDGGLFDFGVVLAGDRGG